MTESRPSSGSGDRPPGPVSSEQNLVNIVYILYLVSMIFGVTGLIGVVIAYVNRRDAPAWLGSHYDFQIRTFWIGLLFFLIGAVTTLIFIGWLLILIGVVWLIIRCVRGMKHLARGEPYPNPKSWLFG
jgi:uncharacterized membrane protein